MDNNLEFRPWTQNKRNLKHLNQLKDDILNNFGELNLKDEKIIVMLSGGKDSAVSLAIAKDLGLNVHLCVHFVHKWSWDISTNEAKKLADRFNVPIIFPDITEELAKKTQGAKGKSICRICKTIMKARMIDIAKVENAKIIMTGETALEKIAGPVFQYIRENNKNVKRKDEFELYKKMEITKVPKRYKIHFFRPLIRVGHFDVFNLQKYYNIDIKRVNEAGNKIGYWREGCCLQYCSPTCELTTELFDDLYKINKKATEIARDCGFRASITLPAKEITVIPEEEKYLKKIEEILKEI
ncbi:PP-loop domain-containing protein [Methanococcus maripaludis X1]|uniref:PP-loop domain-containing protein n=1 Tax=Methanococcus maripaludis X1 TaxID=1053692 RepID=G0H1H2_METMI|nr:phosphoadenosine phosphosulfate reductase family protein [Methanococcus maripaludis]AEK20257.1 PP-loop domain-containing protein [Methanococcus maripaludis X1]